MENEMVKQIKAIKTKKLNNIIDYVVNKYLLSKHKHYLSKYVTHIFMRLHSDFSHRIKLDSKKERKDQLRIILSLNKLHLITGYLSNNGESVYVYLTKAGKQLCNQFCKPAKVLHKQLHHKDIIVRIALGILTVLGIITASDFFYGVFSWNPEAIAIFLGLVAITLIGLVIEDLYVYSMIRPNQINQKQLIPFLISHTSLNKKQILHTLGYEYYHNELVMKHQQPDYDYKFFRR